MGKTTYRYNPDSCRYEPEIKDGRKVFRNSVIFLSISMAFAVTCFVFYYPNSESFTEVWLKRQNTMFRSEWTVLEKRIDQASQHLNELIDKDDNNYRVILDSQPLPASIRNAGVGGSEKQEMREVEAFPSIYADYKRIDKLNRQLDIETQSYQQIKQMLDEKIRMWASRPAIQPIDNRQLNRLHLTYGLRMHPIFHVFMDHKGLDFAAPRGTPIYATGDGKITKAYFSGSYGNVIYINHGHGYETRYAHLSRFDVKPGDRVKRGQVIGLVGNTGNSIADHLHYEVLYKGQHINPINFFQRDLSNHEYEKLIRIGTAQNAPLD